MFIVQGTAENQSFDKTLNSTQIPVVSIKLNGNNKLHSTIVYPTTVKQEDNLINSTTI